MPALYAHNKFGKKVIKNLPPILKDIIRKYPNSFRIGLQGPDILFFYKPWKRNKVNQAGLQIHHENAYAFFENALSIIRKEGFDSAHHSYILGFICHFVLDKYCHPLVNQYMTTTNCGHIEIEGDFEHFLLELDKKNPLTYSMDKLVPTDEGTALSLACFYPELSYKEIHTAMRHMKSVKKIFIAPKKTKQTVINCLLRSTFHYKYFKGHMLTSKANEKCRHHMPKLYEQFVAAVPIANHMIEKFEICLYLNTKLPNIFSGNFYENANEISQ